LTLSAVAYCFERLTFWKINVMRAALPKSEHGQNTPAARFDVSPG
jgi:hypothetical protein